MYTKCVTFVTNGFFFESFPFIINFLSLVTRMYKLVLVIITVVCFPCTVLSKMPSAIGVGIGWENAPYKRYKHQYYPMPYVNYDNGIGYLENTEAGLYLFNDDHQNLTLSLNYLSNEFQPNDSKDSQLLQLTKRHPTLLAVLEYAFDTNIGSFSVNVGHDVLNQSQSLLVNLDYNAPLFGDQWILLFKIGVAWSNHRHNTYYYGVSDSESLRSGLKYYKANSALTPNIAVTGQYLLAQSIGIFTGIKAEWLTGDIARSPLIANKVVPSAYTGLFYSF